MATTSSSPTTDDGLTVGAPPPQPPPPSSHSTTYFNFTKNPHHLLNHHLLHPSPPQNTTSFQSYHQLPPQPPPIPPSSLNIPTNFFFSTIKIHLQPTTETIFFHLRPFPWACWPPLDGASPPLAAHDQCARPGAGPGYIPALSPLFLSPLTLSSLHYSSLLHFLSPAHMHVRGIFLEFRNFTAYSEILGE